MKEFFNEPQEKYPVEDRSLSRAPELLLEARGLALCSSSQARDALTYEKALELQVLPVGLTKAGADTVLKAAWSKTENGPEEQELVQILRFVTGYKTELTEISKEVLSKALQISYLGDEAVLFDSKKQLNQSVPPPSNAKKHPSFILSSNDPEGQYLQSVVNYACSHEATDIHLIPSRDGSTLRIRIAGKLITHNESICSLAIHERLIRRLKVLCKIPNSPSTAAIDGAFTASFGHTPVSLRVSIMPTLYGERAALRILGIQKPRSLNEIGLSPFTLENLHSLKSGLQGAVIFCGATGSGKTSTAYAYLGSLCNAGLNLVSIEDPVEAEVQGVVQTSISSQTGFTFSAALQGILRQDPDVILLGEIRSSDSAQIALEAAMTGHLLISTAHCSNVFSLIKRLALLGVSTDTLSSALRLIVCVKLVPQLCSKCRVIDLQASEVLGIDSYKGNGCTACDYTGFNGRRLIEQTLSVDTSFSHRLLSGAQTFQQFQSVLTKQNYRGFAESALPMLRQGNIDLSQYTAIAHSW